MPPPVKPYAGGAAPARPCRATCPIRASRPPPCWPACPRRPQPLDAAQLGRVLFLGAGVVRTAERRGRTLLFRAVRVGRGRFPLEVYASTRGRRPACRTACTGTTRSSTRWSRSGRPPTGDGDHAGRHRRAVAHRLALRRTRLAAPVLGRRDAAVPAEAAAASAGLDPRLRTAVPGRGGGRAGRRRRRARVSAGAADLRRRRTGDRTPSGRRTRASCRRSSSRWSPRRSTPATGTRWAQPWPHGARRCPTCRRRTPLGRGHPRARLAAPDGPVGDGPAAAAGLADGRGAARHRRAALGRRRTASTGRRRACTAGRIWRTPMRTRRPARRAGADLPGPAARPAEAAYVVISAIRGGRLDDRGYREAQLAAGMVEGRLHLAAYALGASATGMTFLDSEVPALLGQPDDLVDAAVHLRRRARVQVPFRRGAGRPGGDSDGHAARCVTPFSTPRTAADRRGDTTPPGG